MQQKKGHLRKNEIWAERGESWQEKDELTFQQDILLAGERVVRGEGQKKRRNILSLEEGGGRSGRSAIVGSKPHKGYKPKVRKAKYRDREGGGPDKSLPYCRARLGWPLKERRTKTGKREKNF